MDNGQGILGTNMYAYCLNNPVNMVDYDGEIPQWVMTGVIHLAITVRWGLMGWVGYYAIKGAISAAANVYLSSKGYPIAQALFNKFMWGGSLSQKTTDRMKDAFKSSSILTNAVNQLLKTIKGNSVNNLKGTVNFTSGDLLYAVGRAEFYILGTKQSNGKWNLIAKVVDTYNFDSIWTLSKGLTTASLANDLGWAMQRIGMGRDYTWSVTFSKVY